MRRWRRMRRAQKLIRQADLMDGHTIGQWFLASDTRPLIRLQARAAELRKQAWKLMELS